MPSFLCPLQSPVVLVQNTIGIYLFDERVSDIPAFSRQGYLPDGIHDACFEQVLERFTTNPDRKALGRRLEKFLLKVIDSKDYSYAYLGGEFITRKAAPREVDLTLQLQERFGIHAFVAMEGFLRSGLNSILREYSVRLRFCFGESTDGLDSFRDYFENVCSVKEAIVFVSSKIKRGVVRIKL